MLTFDELVAKDVQDVFLGEHAQTVTYIDNMSIPKTIRAQLFFDKVDGLDSVYEHAWCDANDVPNISKGDIFEINGERYGVLEFIIDEHQHGVDIYLNKV